MYKITIKRTVGDLVTATTLVTDNLELIKQILVSEEILKVETDAPNESIDDEYQMLRKIWEDAQKPLQPFDPLKPYRDSGSWPFNTPCTVTC